MGHSDTDGTIGVPRQRPKLKLKFQCGDHVQQLKETQLPPKNTSSSFRPRMLRLRQTLFGPSALIRVRPARHLTNPLMISPAPLSEAANQHFSVDLDGKPVVDLTFASEPLGMPAEDGYGWPYIEAGQFIGPENRYQICRKLGWGMSSSTWLARDKK